MRYRRIKGKGIWGVAQLDRLNASVGINRALVLRGLQLALGTRESLAEILLSH